MYALILLHFSCVNKNIWKLVQNYIFVYFCICCAKYFSQNVTAMATSFLGINAVVLKLVKIARISSKMINWCYGKLLRILHHICLCKNNNTIISRNKLYWLYPLTLVLISICIRFIAGICLFCYNCDELGNRQFCNARPSTKQ